MKLFVPMAMFSFLLSACGGISGQLTVAKPFSLIDRWGNKFEIASGQENLSLRYKENKHRLILTLNDRNETIEISTPENFSIPENGSFEMKGSESGQLVDLKGVTQTRQRKSPEYLDRQSCQTTQYEPVCSTGPNGQTTCSVQPVTKWGMQDVRYYNLETRQIISASFLATEESVAEFNADNSWNERREVYTGPCW